MPCPATVMKFRITRLLPLPVVELQRLRVRYVVPSSDVGETADLRSEPAPRPSPLASCLLQPRAASEPGEFPCSEG